MTDTEVKELIAKASSIIKTAESEINEMKILLHKFKGDKTKPTYRIESMTNLLNYSIANQTRINDLESYNAKLIFKIGEINYQLKMVSNQLLIAEQVGEFNVDESIQKISDNLIKEFKE